MDVEIYEGLYVTIRLGMNRAMYVANTYMHVCVYVRGCIVC